MKVLDRNGVELKVGSQVAHSELPGTPHGTVKGPRWLQFSGWSFEVFWPQDGERIQIVHSLKVEDPEPDTYRCPDLLAQPEKAGS